MGREKFLVKLINTGFLSKLGKQFVICSASRVRRNVFSKMGEPILKHSASATEQLVFQYM